MHDRLFFWFFRELETCESEEELLMFYTVYRNNLYLIDNGEIPIPLIVGYMDLMLKLGVEPPRIMNPAQIMPGQGS